MADTDARTAGLTWVKDDDPRWDADRERVFATVPVGAFRPEQRAPGERLSSDWWRVRDGDRVVGYGWLDDVWGDAEILLAVEASARGTGAGAFALARLEEEAAARGLHYVVNVGGDTHPDRGAGTEGLNCVVSGVRDTHPDGAGVTEWFIARGFSGTDDGRLRKRGGEGPPHAGRLPDEGRGAASAAARERAVARPRLDTGVAG